MVFRLLDGMKAREISSLDAGEYLVAVYGDNWFQKTNYMVAARQLGNSDDVKEVGRRNGLAIGYFWT